uniref:Uncharacterized protein n=1 Tax=Kalanchoe fedtschenkoi TaxID=63787 RepID=A0A7N0UHT4_KALFE
MAATRYQVRSISLPSKSHPTVLRIHEELNKLRSLRSLSPCTSEVICSSLAGLEELYTCMDGFLNMESTQEAFSHCKDAACVSELLDGSVQLLDVCVSSRDCMMEVKERVQDLQSLLRRRKGDSNIEKSICSYASLRQKMKKDSKNMIAALRRMAPKLETPAVEDQDEAYASMIKILMDVNVATVGVFESLLSFFFSSPLLSSKTTKWSVISRLRKKKVAAWEGGSVNEFTAADAALLSSDSSEGCWKHDTVIASDRLVALETSAEAIEKHLERIFRHLVASRVSLLNTFSR